MIPYFRAKSNERKNTYVEGLLIGVDEELNLCTIRTRDDYIGGEVCYLHTLSINFPDMLDSQGNKIFASLQEDGKGGDVILFCEVENITGTAIYEKSSIFITGGCSEYLSEILQSEDEDFKIIGIQQ